MVFSENASTRIPHSLIFEQESFEKKAKDHRVPSKKERSKILLELNRPVFSVGKTLKRFAIAKVSDEEHLSEVMRKFADHQCSASKSFQNMAEYADSAEESFASSLKALELEKDRLSQTLVDRRCRTFNHEHEASSAWITL